jgi:hypothetical protein
LYFFIEISSRIVDSVGNCKVVIHHFPQNSPNIYVPATIFSLLLCQRALSLIKSTAFYLSSFFILFLTVSF